MLRREGFRIDTPSRRILPDSRLHRATRPAQDGLLLPSVPVLSLIPSPSSIYSTQAEPIPTREKTVSSLAGARMIASSLLWASVFLVKVGADTVCASLNYTGPISVPIRNVSLVQGTNVRFRGAAVQVDGKEFAFEINSYVHGLNSIAWSPRSQY